MSDPCGQEPVIRQLVKGQDKLFEKLDAQNTLLGQLVEQKKDIEHLTALLMSLDRVQDDHENRLRIVERTPGRVATKGFWLLFAAAASSVSAVVSGILVWVLRSAL